MGNNLSPQGNYLWYGVVWGVCVVFVRCLWGVYEVFVRGLCGVCEEFVRRLCSGCAIDAKYEVFSEWCYHVCEVFVMSLWGGSVSRDLSIRVLTHWEMSHREVFLRNTLELSCESLWETDFRKVSQCIPARLYSQEIFLSVFSCNNPQQFTTLSNSSQCLCGDCVVFTVCVTVFVVTIYFNMVTDLWF